jgi:predicted DNA-binding transcriptional regulator AlpA
MERIVYELGGRAPAVVLTNDDRTQFKDALKKVNASMFAKDIGITRPHLYSLISSQRMEFLRFRQLEQELGLSLLSYKDLILFLSQF